MGIPAILADVPPPDTNLDSRIVLGGVDLSMVLATDKGSVTFSGIDLDGWSGGTASTRDTSQRAYRPGAVASQYPQSTPRVMTLSMVLNADSPAAMREAWDLLNVAASKDDTTLIRDQFGVRRSCTVFRQGDIAESRFPSPYTKRWSCQLKAADPRKYGDTVNLSTGLPFVTGGLLAPLTAPILSTASTATGTVSWTNQGNEQSPVRLRIDGPVRAPVVTHLGSGRSLMLASSYLLPSGSWLDIDLERHSVVEAGQVSRAQFVTSRGFFTADPGRNDFVFTADTYDADARLTVTTAPAWE